MPSPLTGTRFPASSNSPNVPQDVQNAVTDVETFTIPRFASTAARDTAYAAMVTAGGVMKDGMVCWCDAPGSFFDRVGGTWVSRKQPRVWSFPRSSVNSSDNFATSGMVSLISGSISNAPAGDYLVTTRWVISNTSTGAGFMLTTANGASVAAGSSNARADFQPNRSQVSQVGYVSGFAGGTLTLVGSLQSSTGGTPTVWTDGSEIVVAYLGAH